MTKYLASFNLNSKNSFEPYSMPVYRIPEYSECLSIRFFFLFKSFQGAGNIKLSYRRYCVSIKNVRFPTSAGLKKDNYIPTIKIVKRNSNINVMM